MRSSLLLLGLVALFLGWNAPNHYPPWTTFHLELFSAVGVCLISLALLFRPEAARLPAAGAPLPSLTRLPMPTAARIWLLVSLWPVAQYLAGGLAFRGDALVGLLYGLGIAMSVYAGQLWAAQEGSARVVRTLCLALVLGGLAANGVALGQWLRLGTPGWWAMELIDDRPFASFAQPNHFGLLMVMAIVAVTALFESGAIKSRFTHALALAFFGWGVLISQSRASKLALLAIVACWFLTRHRAPTRMRPAYVLAATGLWWLMGLAVAPMQGQLLLAPSAQRAVVEVGPRELIWVHFWTAITEHPWLGYGFNQGVLALAEVAERVQPSRNVIFAHNFVLDLMTWVGIPLALALVLALGCWMIGWLRKTPDTALMAQRHWVLAIWLSLLIQSLLEFPYAHAYFLLPASLLAGAVTARSDAGPAPGASASFTASRPAIAVAAAAAALLGVLCWEYFQLEEDFRVNRFERANFGRVEHQPLERPWVLDQLAALNASAQIHVAPGMTATQIQALHLLARRFHMVSIRIDYAMALALNGQLAQAEREMKIVRSVSAPVTYERIEREWRTWLQANQGCIAPGGQAPR